MIRYSIPVGKDFDSSAMVASRRWAVSSALVPGCWKIPIGTAVPLSR